MFNIIGDIAGQYETLLALVERMPKCPIILCGDLIDRGPRSRDVVKWAMTTANVITVLGNHEDMLLQHVRHDARWSNWLRNGGQATLDSFGGKIPDDVVQWITTLPLYYYYGGLLVTHAPYSHAVDREAFIWNREEPIRSSAFYNVFGHNSHWGLETFSDAGVDYATCIDTSRSEILTGMHWPSRTIYQQPYLILEDEGTAA